MSKIVYLRNGTAYWLPEYNDKVDGQTLVSLSLSATSAANVDVSGARCLRYVDSDYDAIYELA